MIRLFNRKNFCSLVNLKEYFGNKIIDFPVEIKFLEEYKKQLDFK